jgi:hypothetical protein
MAYWKQHERRVAQATGGKRTSRPWGDLPDTESDWLVTECKARQKLPQWIVKAVASAKRHATAAQLPIAVLHEKGRHQKNDLVVMAFEDFVEWFSGQVPGATMPESEQ